MVSETKLRTLVNGQKERGHVKKEKLLETHVTQISNCFLIFSMHLKSRLLSISQREWWPLYHLRCEKFNGDRPRYKNKIRKQTGHFLIQDSEEKNNNNKNEKIGIERKKERVDKSFQNAKHDCVNERFSGGWNK